MFFKPDITVSPFCDGDKWLIMEIHAFIPGQRERDEERSRRLLLQAVQVLH